MDKYIKEKDVIKLLKKAYFDPGIQSAKDDPCIVDAMIDWAIRQVKSIPGENVKPVILARWIFDGDCCHCSNCKTTYNWWADSQTSNYCPSCNAFMKWKEGEQK